MPLVAQSRNIRVQRPHTNMVLNLINRETVGTYAMFKDGREEFAAPDWAAAVPCLPLGYSRERGEIRVCQVKHCGRKMRKALIRIQLGTSEGAPFETVLYHEPWCTACRPTP